VEVAGLGVLLLVLVLLELNQTHWNQIVQNFAWVYAVIGITLALIGLELLSLTKHLQVSAK